MPDIFAAMFMVGLIASLVIYIVAERSNDVQSKIFLGKLASITFMLILSLSLSMLDLDDMNLFLVMRGVISVFLVRDTYVLLKKKTF